MNEELRKDIETVVRIATAHTKVNTAEFGVILRVMDAIKKQPTPPAEGEATKINAVVFHCAASDCFYIAGTEGVAREDIIEQENETVVGHVDVLVPRIPVVEARVVEGGQS